MSHLLPVEGERTRLLEALAELVAQRGHATLVRAPILRPHPSHFPDAWSPDANGVRAMARRLMSHAGLGAFDVHITLYENEVQLQHTASVGGVGYSRHKEGAEDRQHEEQLTDLTTIFLGFGLLTTNNTFRSRASGALMGSSTVHSWSVGGLGYLSPQVMSFLLAAQVVARGSEREEVRTLKRALRPTQAESFGAALKLLEPEREALRGRLGVPPPLQWEALPPPMPLPDGVAREEGTARHRAAEEAEAGAGEGARGAAPPEPPVPQSGERTARIFFSVALRLVLVFGGFFAVCMGYLYYFGHA